ncbi:TraK family protein [Nitrosospira multiformis]|uniref:TraK family protein n=1 Tax=Nitrosospira multiformis TaxID=1231 RepID=UPI00094571EF
MSPKNLSYRILVRVESAKSTRNARNLAAFLSLRSEIETALKDGWALRHIWETLHEEGKIGFGYGAFCRRVNRSITVNKTALTRTSSATSHETRSAKPAVRNGFKFDSTPNKEELL